VRSYQKCKNRRFLFKSLSKYWVLEHRFWSIVAGADIPLDCDIGGGLQLPHPIGVVIFPGAVIGPNCLISQQVTIGVGGPKPGAPVIGGHVDIGAGAKILGGVKIGDHARIGANAVVLEDVPNGATAVGVPARIVHGRNTPRWEKTAKEESDSYQSSLTHDPTDNTHVDPGVMRMHSPWDQN
jgi:serine O-acetyltransferase